MQSSRKNISNKGFSLIELSIVIVIVGIMLASALKMGSAAMNSGKITETNKKLAVIQSALQLYLETNGTLPCPAPGTVATSGATFGTSTWASATACSSHTLAGAANTVYIGAVPTRTLGLPDSYAFDGWGNKISYVVDIDCITTEANAWKTSFDTTGFQCYNGAAATTTANITIKDSASTNTVSASGAYVLISHGKNGVGGWNKTTSRISAPCPTSTYEIDNGSFTAGCGSNTIDSQFRDGTINDGNVAASYFDDIVRWQTDDMMNFCRYNSTDC